MYIVKPNISHEIRWSLDFRWVKASDPLGVYGVKEGIRMRSSENPSLKIDWEGFNRNDRRGAMRRALNLKVSLTEMLSVNYKPLLHGKASIMILVS